MVSTACGANSSDSSPPPPLPLFHLLLPSILLLCPLNFSLFMCTFSTVILSLSTPALDLSCPSSFSFLYSSFFTPSLLSSFLIPHHASFPSFLLSFYCLISSLLTLSLFLTSFLFQPSLVSLAFFSFIFRPCNLSSSFLFYFPPAISLLISLSHLSYSPQRVPSLHPLSYPLPCESHSLCLPLIYSSSSFLFTYFFYLTVFLHFSLAPFSFLPSSLPIVFLLFSLNFPFDSLLFFLICLLAPFLSPYVPFSALLFSTPSSLLFILASLLFYCFFSLIVFPLYFSDVFLQIIYFLFSVNSFPPPPKFPVFSFLYSHYLLQLFLRFLLFVCLACAILIIFFLSFLSLPSGWLLSSENLVRDP